MERKDRIKKAMAVIQAALFLSMSFALIASVETEAAFIDASSIAVPWTSDFTPLDSAWDPTGNHCVVVGNDTSEVQSSAWYYNEGLQTWGPIEQGYDQALPAVNLVKNMGTGLTYTSIQLAIDFASSGDSLRVWSGTYNENVVINKQLTLTGNGSATTIINGGNIGPAVTVAVSNVKMYGFNVTGGSSFPGIILQANVQSCRIENNTVYGNSEGVLLEGASFNVIKNNDMRNNAVGLRTSDGVGSKSLVGTTESEGLADSGALFKTDMVGGDYQKIHDFIPGYTDGHNPEQNSLVQDLSDTTMMYGMTPGGGTYGGGILFKTNKAGTFYSVLHHFNKVTDGYAPRGKVTQFGTTLFGMTSSGGTYGYGTIFRINMNGTGFAVMRHFQSLPDGSSPQGSLLLDGTTLYGMTLTGGTSSAGTIFSITTAGTGYSVIKSFTGSTVDGGSPRGSLITDGTTLYGMTYAGGTAGMGTVFRIDKTGSAFAVLMSFTGAANGQNPYGDLLLDAGMLYGMAYRGGANNMGVLFKIGTTGSGFGLLRSFITATGSYPFGSLVQDATNIYGFTQMSSVYGTIFSFNKATLVYTSYNPPTSYGYSPWGSPLLDGTTLYGMMYYGGTFSKGTVFRITTTLTGIAVIHNFQSSATGCTVPRANVVQYGSYLYGVANTAGSLGNGAIYRIRTDSSDFKIIHNFTGGGTGGGREPNGELLCDGTYLYGMTRYGGSAVNRGVVFRINLDGTGYTAIYSFTSSPDGAYPYGGLVMDGSTLYGMTSSGGTPNFGTIFRVNTDGSGYIRLHEFSGGVADGSTPYGNLVLSGGALYGVTRAAGASSYGTLFTVNTDGTGYSVLYNFGGVAGDGRYPYASPVLIGNVLYGTTESGGSANLGTIYRINTDGTGYSVIRNMAAIDGSLLYPTLTVDGNTLYGMANAGGTASRGTVFSIDKDTYAFTILHHFLGYPNDAGNPYGNRLSVINNMVTSTGNTIFHNNFIANTLHARDDSGSNNWDNGLPSGGNYWGGFTASDAEPDNIGDDPYYIAGTGAEYDSLPWLKETGWFRATFRSIAWDQVHQRFWICGEFSPDSLSTFYYIPVGTPTTMVPIQAPPYTFTALAADNLGNLMIGGNDLPSVFYYVPASENGYSVDEYGTGSMYGWNITSITFNPNDSRFYFVGNVENMNVGIAFYSDTVPLTAASYCYLDTSDFMNMPGIGGLRSIAWNPTANYALAVGDGVYRVNQYDGNPSHELSWSIISAPQAGRSYYDVSWDSDGWNEAGIVGTNSGSGTYWRYYNTNPHLLDGYTSLAVGNYPTCAMKPPASPKWLILLGSGEGVRVNISEKDESNPLSFSANLPHIFTLNIWKQADPLKTNLADSQVDPETVFTFFIEGNYTVNGVDHWNDLWINITAWYDDGLTGAASVPGDPSWSSPDYRTRQFSLSCNLATNTFSTVYPVPPAGDPSVREFYIASYWSDPASYGSDGNTHHLYVNVSFGPHTYVAAGDGIFNMPGTNHTDPNQVLNDAFTWDLDMLMEDINNNGYFNQTYMEFGIKKFAQVSSTGNPSGSAPPGTANFHLSNPVTIYYSSNTQTYVTVAIQDLHLNGDPLETHMITANNLAIRNTHSLAIPATSDVALQTDFTAANAPLYVWGISSGTPLAAPFHGTESAGPAYTDYSAGATFSAFELTVVDWWVDVPISTSSGVYRGTITITITDTL